MQAVVIKWGKRYGVNCTNSLFRSFRRHAPAEMPFFCLTNDTEGLDARIQCLPLPDIELPERYRWTFWRKISLFSPVFPLAGPCLFLDLDTVILRPIEPLLAGWDGRPRFIRSFAGQKSKKAARYDEINSSVMLYAPARCTAVWFGFHADSERILATYSSDQGFIYDTLHREAQFFPDGACVSFKKHCLQHFPFNLITTPQPPKNSIVVCFHGKPDPEEAAVGYWGGKWKYRCHPAPWAVDNGSFLSE